MDADSSQICLYTSQNKKLYRALTAFHRIALGAEVVMAMVVVITITGVIMVVPPGDGDCDVGDDSSSDVVVMEEMIC